MPAGAHTPLCSWGRQGSQLGLLLNGGRCGPPGRCPPRRVEGRDGAIRVWGLAPSFPENSWEMPEALALRWDPSSPPPCWLCVPGVGALDAPAPRCSRVPSASRGVQSTLAAVADLGGGCRRAARCNGERRGPDGHNSLHLGGVEREAVTMVAVFTSRCFTDSLTFRSRLLWRRACLENVSLIPNASRRKSTFQEQD